MNADTAEKVGEPKWLLKRKELARSRQSDLELPTAKTPGWEFTDLSGFDPDSYVVAKDGDRAALNKSQPLLPPVDGAIHLDQVDSTSVPSNGDNDTATDVSSGGKPDGAVVMPLDRAALVYPELVEKQLGSIVASDNRFVAANDANWCGGAFIYVPAGEKLKTPVQITVVQDSPGSAVFWRTLVVLEEGAEAEIWEQYLSSGREVEGLFNAVVELCVGPGTSLRYLNGQGLSEKSWVFGTQRARIECDASIEWVALGFGSSNGKVRMETKLAGDGSSVKVTGAYAGNKVQHLDFDTTQEHAAEHTTSDLAFRGVLEDGATSVWRGMIEVDPGAQHTDAFQESRNLLLSKDAHADAIPGLEIEANEVRCTHAAAVAQIDQTQIFFLMSRGLSRESATRLVIDGFMEALVERLKDGPMRAAVADALERRLAEILD